MINEKVKIFNTQSQSAAKHLLNGEGSETKEETTLKVENIVRTLWRHKANKMSPASIA